MNKPRIGISACLLGQKVRYNGADKRDDWLVDVLGKYVTWIPICPEVEMGLGVPRPTMRLQGRPSDPKLIVHNSGENLTELARKTTQTILARKYEFDSYIFKRDSPSCGLERVKIYGKNDSPSKSARGLFADGVLERYPSIPMIEEGRLMDPAQRDLYLVKLFAWAEFNAMPLKIAAIQKFHEHYKLLLMAHAPTQYSKLGKIVANSNKEKPSKVFSLYGEQFMKAMILAPTRKQWVNVLQHIFGYFKTTLSPREKQLVLKLIEGYRQGEVSLVEPLRLLHHLAQVHSVSYLLEQKVFEPFPAKLRGSL